MSKLPSAKAARMATDLHNSAADIDRMREEQKKRAKQREWERGKPARTHSFLSALGPEIRVAAEKGQYLLTRDIADYDIDHDLLRQELITAGYRVIIIENRKTDGGCVSTFLEVRW